MNNALPTTPLSLKQAIRRRDWAAGIRSYLQVLLGFIDSTYCKWDVVKERIAAAEAMCPSSLQEVILKPFISYLKGAYCQGTGDFGQALAYYQDDTLSLALDGPSSKYERRHMAVLAALNRIWIMQHPAHRDNHTTKTLLHEIEPFFKDQYDTVLSAAFLCVRATIVIDPPHGRAQQKADAHKALHESKRTTNALSNSIALSVAQALLYNNLLGEQPQKCVIAADHWAAKAKNPLWQSVVSGIRCESAQARVEPENVQMYLEKGTKEAQRAMMFHS